MISLENSDRTALNSSYKDIWIKDNKLGVEFDERELVVSVKKNGMLLILMKRERYWKALEMVI